MNSMIYFSMTYLSNFQNMIIIMIIIKHGLTTAKMNITRKKNRIKWREKIIYHFLLLQHFLCLFKLQKVSVANLAATRENWF